jgi:hypothetical protein
MYSIPFVLSLVDFAVGAVRFSHILILLPVIWVYPLYLYGLEAGLNIPVYNFKEDYSDSVKLYYILGASGRLLLSMELWIESLT